MINRELTDLLDSLAAGNPPAANAVTLLSDLDRDSAAALRNAWKDFTAATRRDLVEEAALLIGERIELDFQRLLGIALDDPEPDLRRLAIAGMSESTNHEWERRLTGMVTADPDVSVRRAAAAGLRAFVLEREFGQGGDGVVEALRARFNDPGEDPEVRGEALVSLGPCSEPWVHGHIEAAYYSDDRVLRLSAIEAMGGSADDGWLEFLFEQFESVDPDFRIEAALACGEIGSEDAVDMLASLFDDEDSDVAAAAVSAIGSIGGPAALRCLRAFAEHAPEDLEDPIARAMEVAGFITAATTEDGGDA